MSNLIVLTGATGFIGPHVLAALVEAGFRVRVVGPEPVMETDQVSWVKADFLDNVEHSTLVSGASVVVHLAAELWDSTKMDDVNVVATGALAQASEQEGVGLFLYTSSVGVYGHPSVPFIDESTPTLSVESGGGDDFLAEPFLFDYCVTKLKGEHLVHEYLHKTPGIILRLSNVVSEAEIAKVMEWGMLTRIWRGYRNTHQIYVKDVAAAIVYFINKHFSGQLAISLTPETYNVSNDADPNNRYSYLFERLAKATGNWRCGCPFTLPAFFDIVKDRVKFRMFSSALPAGVACYSPSKLLRSGFSYRYGIGTVQEKVIRELAQKMKSGERQRGH